MYKIHKEEDHVMKLGLLVASVVTLAALSACAAPGHHHGGDVYRHDTSPAHDARPEVHRMDPARNTHSGY
jgi:hypothetical protein